MTKTSYHLLIISAIFLLTRLVAMIYFPLQDTTEARYGEIARIMAETGDWITPYFDYGVPFWGKPPLVFWLEALSIKLFGFNDFAPRFPSWLFTIATAGLIYTYLRKVKDIETALWGVTIYLSILLVFLLSGVVILDPIFTFATTLAYIAFAMVLRGEARYWGYLFFTGVALGLLSKGPLVIVLVGGTIGLWLLFSTRRWRVFKLYPWVGGLALMLLITLPWYIMAEMKTPGFIDYFIVGEHFKRFIDSGWEGDLYGVAHHKPHGQIWLYWLGVSLPWGIIAIALLARRVWRERFGADLRGRLFGEEYSFFIIWALFPMLFFTMSGNILATYVLPGLPALALVLALYLGNNPVFTNERYRRAAMLTLLVEPLLVVVFLIYTDSHREMIRTEKYLIEEYRSLAQQDEPLYYLRKRPFSARYYTEGQMELMTFESFEKVQREKSIKHYYLAIPQNRVERVETILAKPVEKLYSSRLYYLIEVDNRD